MNITFSNTFLLFENAALLNNVKDGVESGRYELRIRLGSYRREDRKYFAEVEIDNEFLDSLKESTSAIITWYTELLYNEENSSNVTSGNIQTEGI